MNLRRVAGWAAVFGLLMVYSASIASAGASRQTGFQETYFLLRQGVYLAVAVVAGVVAFQVPMRAWQKMSPWLFLAGIAMLALVSLVIAITSILMALRPRLRGMAALLLGIAAVLEAAFSEGAREFSIGRPGWEFVFHVSMATLAFAFLTIGAVLAVAQVVVDRRLRSRRPLGWLKILLTLALVTGAFFIEDLFAQHLVHKVVLAIIAWIVFGILLLGRWRMGWRGRQALRWTLAGYALLGLSYFGSKLILESVLGKHWG